MRIAALAVALCAATAALAQDTSVPSAPFNAEFDRTPEVIDYQRLRPALAGSRNMQGLAVLCCVVRDDRGLNCAVAFEGPSNIGFGDASLQIAEKYRLSEASYARYRSNPYNFIRRMVVWDSPYGRTGEFQDAVERTDQVTSGICRAPVAAAAPASAPGAP